jgi:hypothetical protein
LIDFCVGELKASFECESRDWSGSKATLMNEVEVQSDEMIFIKGFGTGSTSKDASSGWRKQRKRTGSDKRVAKVGRQFGFVREAKREKERERE